MNPQRGRVVVIAGAVLALFVILGSGFLVARKAGGIPDRAAPRRALLPRSATVPHNRVDMTAGEVELETMLRFLGEHTGLLLRYDVTDTRITEAKLELVAPMHDIDAESVRALIEASGFSVEVETSVSGLQVIRVGVQGDRDQQ